MPKTETKPAADDLSVTPRYRTTGKDWVAVNGIPAPPGTEFDAKFWPMWPLTTMNNLEAVNETARRVLAYVNKFRFGSPPVDSIWNDQADRYFLPEPANDYRSTMVRVVGEADRLPGMPLYRALVDFDDGPLVPHRPFPHRKVKVSDELAILTWPDRLLRREFEPANREAELVWNYYEANAENPKLATSPWCWFHLAIWLPDLPAVRRPREAA